MVLLLAFLCFIDIFLGSVPRAAPTHCTLEEHLISIGYLPPLPYSSPNRHSSHNTINPFNPLIDRAESYLFTCQICRTNTITKPVYSTYTFYHFDKCLTKILFKRGWKRNTELSGSCSQYCLNPTHYLHPRHDWFTALSCGTKEDATRLYSLFIKTVFHNANGMADRKEAERYIIYCLSGDVQSRTLGPDQEVNVKVLEGEIYGPNKVLITINRSSCTMGELRVPFEHSAYIQSVSFSRKVKESEEKFPNRKKRQETPFSVLKEFKAWIVRSCRCMAVETDATVVKPRVYTNLGDFLPLYIKLGGHFDNILNRLLKRMANEEDPTVDTPKTNSSVSSFQLSSKNTFSAANKGCGLFQSLTMIFTQPMMSALAAYYHNRLIETFLKLKKKEILSQQISIDIWKHMREFLVPKYGENIYTDLLPGSWTYTFESKKQRIKSCQFKQDDLIQPTYDDYPPVVLTLQDGTQLTADPRNFTVCLTEVVETTASLLIIPSKVPTVNPNLAVMISQFAAFALHLWYCVNGHVTLTVSDFSIPSSNEDIQTHFTLLSDLKELLLCPGENNGQWEFLPMVPTGYVTSFGFLLGIYHLPGSDNYMLLHNPVYASGAFVSNDGHFKVLLGNAEQSKVNESPGSNSVMMQLGLKWPPVPSYSREAFLIYRFRLKNFAMIGVCRKNEIGIAILHPTIGNFFLSPES